MSADISTENAPEFICPICLPKTKSSRFQWKKASLDVHSRRFTLQIGVYDLRYVRSLGHVKFFVSSGASAFQTFNQSPENVAWLYCAFWLDESNAELNHTPIPRLALILVPENNHVTQKLH